MPKIIEKKLVEIFKDRASFTRKELYNFYLQFEPDLKDGTFGWRIYDLKKKNIIRSLKKGIYTLSRKIIYSPRESNRLIKLATQVANRFLEIEFCAWETAWLNEFTVHQIRQSITILEIEKDFTESLFYYLKDTVNTSVFLDPDEQTINRYLSESLRPIVVKKLLTRAPLAKKKEPKANYKIPRLEKMLVDIFVDEKLFYFMRGSELGHFFENAFDKYDINFTKLFGYAQRRGKQTEILEFITTHINHLAKDILHD